MKLYVKVPYDTWCVSRFLPGRILSILTTLWYVLRWCMMKVPSRSFILRLCQASVGASKTFFVMVRWLVNIRPNNTDSSLDIGVDRCGQVILDLGYILRTYIMSVIYTRYFPSNGTYQVLKGENKGSSSGPTGVSSVVLVPTIPNSKSEPQPCVIGTHAICLG